MRGRAWPWLIAAGIGAAATVWWLRQPTVSEETHPQPGVESTLPRGVEGAHEVVGERGPVIDDERRPSSARPTERHVVPAATADPPPRRPNLKKLEGVARVQAVSEFRRARAAWRERNRGRIPSRPRVWASRLLGEPEILTADLGPQDEKELEDLYAGLYSEIREVRNRMELAKDPIYRERLASGQFEERDLEKGYPKSAPGLFHVYGMFPSRNDPTKTIRRVVTIRPGESAQLDRLRAEEDRLRQLAKRTLRERIRFEK